MQILTRRFFPSLVSLLAGVIALALAQQPAGAAPQGRSGPGRPTASEDEVVLLVLISGAEEELVARQERFAAELELALDSVQVTKAVLPDLDLAALPFSEQLARIRPLAQEHGASFTAWVERTENGLSVHLMAVSSGRSWARTAEAGLGPEAESVLALAVREQLWETHLQAGDNGAGKSGQDQARDDKPADRARIGKTDRLDWGLSGFFSGQVGLYGQESAWVGLGGGLGFEWCPARGLVVQGLVRATAVPLADPADGDVHGAAVEPGLGLSYLFAVGSLSLGPILGFQVSWTRLEIDLENGKAQDFSWWNLRSSLGLQGRWPLTDWLAIGGTLEAGAYRSKERFFRATQESMVLATPTIDLRLSVGLTLGFN